MKNTTITSLCLSVMILMLMPLIASAYSNGTDSYAPVTQAAYHVDEQSTYIPQTDKSVVPPADTPASGDGPVRLARFSYIQGNVSWRGSDTDSWSFATVNLPIRQGAEIWVTNGGRAEIQFDDGSLLRLGNGAVATLQTLYSDADGEFTELKVSEGLSTLILKHSKSVYQIDTPLAAVKSNGPSNVRIGVDNDVEIAVRSGKASIQGNDSLSLNTGEYLALSDGNADYNVQRIPGPDTWDTWNDDRDRQLDDSITARHVPTNIGLVTGDLSAYGTWRSDSEYGYVWCPYVYQSDWRPYEYGHWVWVEPFGWTWVSEEPWGWAPYHYGTWVHAAYGWAWVPGPVNQYWCPAVVHFCEYGSNVAWVPLAPREVHYPSILSFGYRHGNWSLFFSIGGAAVYYPHNSAYCEPRPWRNVVINRTTYVNNVTVINNNINNRNVYISKNEFVPRNSRFEGVTSTTVSDFGGRGQYRPEPRGSETIFSRGRGIGAPAVGYAPHAGPIAARPTTVAVTPSRTFLQQKVHPDDSVMRRPVFRGTLPSNVEKVATPVVTRQNPSGGSVRREVRPSFGTPTAVAPADRAREARQSLGMTPRTSRVQERPQSSSTGRDPFQPRQNEGMQPGNRSDQPTYNRDSAPERTAVQPSVRQNKSRPTFEQTRTVQPDSTATNRSNQPTFNTGSAPERTTAPPSVRQSRTRPTLEQNNTPAPSSMTDQSRSSYRYRESSALDTKPWSGRTPSVTGTQRSDNRQSQQKNTETKDNSKDNPRERRRQ